MNFAVGVIIFVSEVYCVVNGTYLTENHLPIVQLYLPKSPSEGKVCTGAVISRSWFKIKVTFQLKFEHKYQ